jgi:hypothetical protein
MAAILQMAVKEKNNLRILTQFLACDIFFINAVPSRFIFFKMAANMASIFKMANNGLCRHSAGNKELSADTGYLWVVRPNLKSGAYENEAGPLTWRPYYKWPPREKKSSDFDTIFGV